MIETYSSCSKQAEYSSFFSQYNESEWMDGNVITTFNVWRKAAWMFC